MVSALYGKKYVTNLTTNVEDSVYIARHKMKKKEMGYSVMYDVVGKKEKVFIAPEIDKLSAEKTIWFWLYNSNHYDEKYGGNTYLDAVLCYLIAFCNGKEDKYGEFIENVNQEEDENQNVVEKFNSPRKYKNFVFKDTYSYALCKQKAEYIARSKDIITCIKVLAKNSLEDPDYLKARYVNAVQDIAENSESEKSRLEAYKLLGTWLGIDKPQVTNNITIQMNAIDSDLRRQGFDVDVTDFVLDEDQTEQ